MNEALRDWVATVENTFYIIGTAAGPHPYPELVRDFQSVIGKETREQMLSAEGRLPDLLIAAVGGGVQCHRHLPSLPRRSRRGDAGGRGGRQGRGQRRACRQPDRRAAGHSPRATRTYLLQDEDGQITEAHSISAGLDYPGIGPEHSWLHESGRVRYVPITDRQALDAFQLCCQKEGIIPALEARTRLQLWRARRWKCARISSSSSMSPGAATRTSTRWPRHWGRRYEPGSD